MRYVLVFLLLVHGVAHLAGFVNREVSLRSPRALWLVLAACCAVVALGVALRASWWLVALEGLIVVSTVFCVIEWPLTKFGVLANILILVVAFVKPMAIRNPDLERLWADAKADAVRLRMTGEIKLGNNWFPYIGEEVLLGDGSFVWAANVSMFGMPVTGSDQWVKGEGKMAWKAFDLFALVKGEGPDVTRSAMGRGQGEMAAWLRPRPGPLSFPRWGNPDGKGYRMSEFRVKQEQEGTFQGRTIPVKIVAGWPEGDFFRAKIRDAEYK